MKAVSNSPKREATVGQSGLTRTIGVVNRHAASLWLLAAAAVSATLAAVPGVPAHVRLGLFALATLIAVVAVLLVALPWVRQKLRPPWRRFRSGAGRVWGKFPPVARARERKEAWLEREYGRSIPIAIQGGGTGRAWECPYCQTWSNVRRCTNCGAIADYARNRAKPAEDSGV